MIKRTLILAVLASACADPGDPVRPPATAPSRVQDGVTYTADVAVMESFPVQLRPSLTLENNNPAPTEIVFNNGCVVLMRAYRSAARSGRAEYDQTRAFGCTAALVEVELSPGARRSFDGSTVSAADVLGDSLPEGRYYLSVVASPFGQEIEIAAGSVDLAQ